MSTATHTATVLCPLGCGRQVAAEQDEIHYCVRRVTIDRHTIVEREYVGTWDGEALFFGDTNHDVEIQMRPYREEQLARMVDLTHCPDCIEPAPRRTTPHGEPYICCGACGAITFDGDDPEPGDDCPDHGPHADDECPKCRCGTPATVIVTEIDLVKIEHVLCSACFRRDFLDNGSRWTVWEVTKWLTPVRPTTACIPICRTCGNDLGGCPDYKPLPPRPSPVRPIPIPCQDMDALVLNPTALRVRLAVLSAEDLDRQAAVYAAWLSAGSGKVVTRETVLVEFRSAIAIHRSGAVQTTISDDLSPVIYELALTDGPALIELLRAHTDTQRQHLAWRFALYLKKEHGIVREPSFIQRGWDGLVVGMAASGLEARNGSTSLAI